MSVDEAAVLTWFVRLRVAGREASASSVYSLSRAEEVDANESVGAVDTTLTARVRLTMLEGVSG